MVSSEEDSNIAEIGERGPDFAEGYCRICNRAHALRHLHWRAQGQLYQYRVYDDVRLVCIPHLHRLLTQARMEFERDIKIPIIIELRTNALRIWEEYPSSSWQWVAGVAGHEDEFVLLRANLSS